MRRPKTRRLTLYRLPDATPTLDGMFDAFTTYVSERALDEASATLSTIEIAGSPAIVFAIQGQTAKATWCEDAATTTGVAMPYTDCRSGAVVLLAVDGVAYALSYGSGYLLIPDELKDHRFGMRFLIRRLNPGQVQDLVRRRPHARGRTDSILVPGGAPVGMLGIAEDAEIIRRIGGRAANLKVTFSSRDDRAVAIQGAVGLQMPFGVEPEALVGDVREVERVCREEQPHTDLAFIDYVQPVADASTKKELDGHFDALLGSAACAEYVVPVVPLSALDQFPDARSFTVKIGCAQPSTYPALEAEPILCRARRQRPGDRVAKLRTGRISMNADHDGDTVLTHARADKWLEVTLSVGARRFFLMDGDWYEIGEEYLRAARDEISGLFPVSPSIVLPPWYLSEGHHERDYNRDVASRCGGYLCLDRTTGVRNPIEPRRGVLEICDLLGPGDELIHVKRAKGSEPLSHLFYQGLVSANSLVTGRAEVREQFAAVVAGLPRGRILEAGFKPKKVVYAILMDNGKVLTPDTLFPFSQVTLAHAARALRQWDITVEVIGIPPA